MAAKKKKTTTKTTKTPTDTRPYKLIAPIVKLTNLHAIPPLDCWGAVSGGKIRVVFADLPKLSDLRTAQAEMMPTEIAVRVRVEVLL